jgi:cold shock CspA family protein
MEYFNKLGEANIDIKIRQEPRGVVMEDGMPKRFAGIISTVETSYAFIIRDGLQDLIFSHSTYNNRLEWDKLRYHMRVSFDLAFNYKGPVAENIAKEWLS